MNFLLKKQKTQSHYNVIKIEGSVVSTRHDSDKPEKINILILSGCFHIYEHCMTIINILGDKIETILNVFFLIYFQGSEF